MSIQPTGGGKSWSHTPPDVLINILYRLPGEELVGARRVCTAWRGLINRSINQSWQFKNSPSRLLIQGLGLGRAGQGGIRKAHTAVYEWRSTAEGVHRLIPPLAGNWDVVGAIKGVLCLTEGQCEKFTLINPVTRSILRIPNPDPPELKVKIWSCGFGYDASRKTYVVLKIVYLEKPGSAEERYINRPSCYVQKFDFSSGNWLNQSACNVQLITKPVLGLGRANELVVSGVPYWLGVDDDGRYLVWFDATESEFRTEKLVWPEEDPVMTCDRCIAEIRDGVLGGVAFQILLNLHVYTRDGPEKWVKNYSITSVHPGRFLGFNMDSELVFQKHGNNEIEPVLLLKETGKINKFVSLGRFESAKKVITYKPSFDRLPSIGKGDDKDKGDDFDLGRGEKDGGDNACSSSKDGKRRSNEDGKTDDDPVTKRTKFFSMHV